MIGMQASVITFHYHNYKLWRESRPRAGTLLIGTIMNARKFKTRGIKNEFLTTYTNDSE